MTKNTEKPLLLVDGSSYLYRAYHALPPLTNSAGQSTGAVYGVIKMLLSQMQEVNTNRVAIIFDAKGKTFRDDLYPEYKAHRPPMPDDLREQIEPLHTIVRCLGLPVLSIPGVEADDVIATLVQTARAQNISVLISTGDKDLAQLVDPHVRLVNTMTHTVLDEAGVLEKFGVRPDQIIDYLALIGDTADNIPGIPKVGPKTAAKWLSEYNTLDNVVVHAGEIKGKIGENLRANLEQLKLSKQLVQLRYDVELPLTLDELKPQAPLRNELEQWYRKLEFRSLLEALLKDANPAVSDTPAENQAPQTTQVQYSTILDKITFAAWLKKLETADCFAFDTETTSLDYMQAELVGLSFAMNAHEAAYVPLAHDYPGAPEQLDRAWVLTQIKPLLEAEAPKIIGQHIKYDMNVLARYSISINALAHDTMLESYILNSTERHDMDSMALKHLQHNTVHFEDIAGKGAKQITFNQIAIDTAAHYAAEDADVTLRLHQHLWPLLQHEKSLMSVYQDIEIKLVPVLSRMERCGVLIDADLLAAQNKELTAEIYALEQKAYQIAGAPFNLGSPKQIQQILFERQGLPVIKKTPTGQPSTAEEVLQELALDYPLPKLLLEHRSYSKLKSTYIERLPEKIDKDTGRVHTSYHQAVAATGRLSSTDPNLQNIPVRSAQGRRIRQAFIPAPGYVMLAADYSQIELRIMAHLSGDKRLLAAFAAGDDIHKATAAEVFGAPLDKVSQEQRRSAKAINFGLIYGMSAFGLARQLNIDRTSAQTYVDLYFQRYPGVKEFMDRIRETAHKQGYVETVYGRRLYLPEINSKNSQLRQYAERTAINAPMQGTAADIIKRAMIVVDAAIETQRRPWRMLMQVHDELVFEVDTNAIDAARTEIKELMESTSELSVPLVVDIGVGANWDEAH